MSKPQIKCLFIAMLSAAVFSTSVFADTIPDGLTEKQVKVLSIAYKVAKEDGYDPAILQGLLMQESKAGAHPNYKIAGPAHSRYYGVSQMKLSAAKAVLNDYPELENHLRISSPSGIIDGLMNNLNFAIRATSKYLLIVGRGKVNNYAIAAYNKGPGGVKKVNPNTLYYTKSVRTHATSNDIKSLNRYLVNTSRIKPGRRQQFN